MRAPLNHLDCKVASDLAPCCEHLSAHMDPKTMYYSMGFIPYNLICYVQISTTHLGRYIIQPNIHILDQVLNLILDNHI